MGNLKKSAETLSQNIRELNKKQCGVYYYPHLLVTSIACDKISTLKKVKLSSKKKIEKQIFTVPPNFQILIAINNHTPLGCVIKSESQNLRLQKSKSQIYY